MDPDPLTRLAPSPTGALHLGNARTFLVNWALARQRGWRILLRIEDLDGPRIKRGAAEQAIGTLEWLGLDWDQGPLYQSHDLGPYHEALASLASQGAIYPCRCTRSQIIAASLSAPNKGDHEVRYSGACRPAVAQPARFPGEQGVAWRFRTSAGTTSFMDHFAGVCEYDVQQTVGDFLVATKAGLPGYQLAVVVDDVRQEVTHIVRGDDLLPSTPRQMLLYDALALGPPPEYVHLPMIQGPDGRRLAKRHGDSRIDSYRAMGVRPERIVGLLAEWCGIGARIEMTAQEFCQSVDLASCPPEAVVFTEQDDAWLKS